MHDARCGDERAHALARRTQHLGTPPTRHHDGELLAADARDDVAGADDARELARDLAQHRVAGRVAEGVVRALEVVDVEQQQAEREPRARGGERRLQALVELAPVREARQRIGAARDVGLRARLLGKGERVLEPLLGALALGDVLHDAVDDDRAVEAAHARPDALPDPAEGPVQRDQPVLEVDGLEREDALVGRDVGLPVVRVHGLVPDVLRILTGRHVADEPPPVVARPVGDPDPVRAQLVRVEQLVDRADDALHLIVQQRELAVRGARVVERLAELLLDALARRDVRHRPVHEHAAVEGRLGTLAHPDPALESVAVADPVLVVDGASGEQAARGLEDPCAVVRVRRGEPARIGSDAAARVLACDARDRARELAHERGRAVGRELVRVQVLLDRLEHPLHVGTARAELVEQLVALREVLDRDHPGPPLGVRMVDGADRDERRERIARAPPELRLVLSPPGGAGAGERARDLLVPVVGPPRERRANAQQLVTREARDLADPVVHVHDHAAAVGKLVRHDDAIGDRVEHQGREVALRAHAALRLEALGHVRERHDDALELAARASQRARVLLDPAVLASRPVHAQDLARSRRAIGERGGAGKLLGRDRGAGLVHEEPVGALTEQVVVPRGR